MRMMKSGFPMEKFRYVFIHDCEFIEIAEKIQKSFEL